VAYAAYTQDMDKSRSKYFNIYTPLGTMDAKLHMEKFLNDYTDSLDAITFVQNIDVSYGDVYSMLFPSSLEEALSREWRTIRSIEHSGDDSTSGGKKHQYLSHGMLIVTSFVCAILGSMSW
jgi:hypothetical protein